MTTISTNPADILAQRGPLTAAEVRGIGVPSFSAGSITCGHYGHLDGSRYQDRCPRCGEPLPALRPRTKFDLFRDLIHKD